MEDIAAREGTVAEEWTPLFEEEEAVEEETEVSEPEMYWVVLLNDDFTPMEFVVDILVDIFHKDRVEATKIMLTVHRTGKGKVATYPYDIAVTKVAQVHRRAREAGHPLRCTVEKA
ncbi:ATP-dependent Clp protease adapter protein clpS [Spirochaeta thermophila DSM 6578]|uniref:ATP-dependent Clp protease adapter protein ClpS n=2 Tax=Winmispira thermophila TaxID=154 RepID=G0GBU1_WINT7|nr:ATP-dependent Clp protease adapter protein clpS [Spirochaeta thermophila DSM 6578]